MNRFLLTSALALTALALGQQRASAWSEFKMSGCFNISYRTGGHHWTFSCVSDPYCPPACEVPKCGDASYYQAVSQKPSGIPAPTPVQKSSNEGWNNGGRAPVGYYIYPQAAYAFYQAPSYWYGR
jgi:hypothetical protein